MKTIEEAAIQFAHEKLDSVMEINIKVMPRSFVFAAAIDGFKAGHKLAQAWFSVKDSVISDDYKGFVNFKIGEYISCKKVDSQIEFINLVRAYGFTHYKPVK